VAISDEIHATFAHRAKPVDAIGVRE